MNSIFPVMLKSLLPLVGVLILFSAAGALLTLIARKIRQRRQIDFLASEGTSHQTQTTPSGRNPYFVRPSILSPTELKFATVLCSLPIPGTMVAVKVRLADVFGTRKTRDYYRAFNPTAQKHVDFLLIDDDTAAPLAGIELDDYTHEREENRERDDFKDEIFAACRLPLIRVPVAREYDAEALRETIAKAIRADESAARSRQA